MSYVDEVIELVERKSRRTGISSGSKRSFRVFKTGGRGNEEKYRKEALRASLVEL